MLPKFAYVRADSIETAVGHLKEEGAFVHAGGTDLLGCLREGILPIQTMVSISALSDLHGIRELSNGGIGIGALTSITEVAENPLLQKSYAALAQGASEVASPQLRNQGTIGGNLCQKPRCWYYRGEFHCLRKGGPTCYAAQGENQFHCIFGSDDVCFIVHPSDTAPPLVAFDAAILIAGSNGSRTVPAEMFHVLPGEDVTKETILKPGEIVTGIRLPPLKEGIRSSYRKVRARRAWDFSIAGVALALQFDGDRVTDGRVVLSGAAPIPWRAKTVEEVIRGKRIDEKILSAAEDAVVDGAMPLEKNEYKIPLFRAVIREELMKISEDTVI